MNELYSNELNEVACNILETIVFAFTEPIDSMPEFESDKFLTAKVPFIGSKRGHLTMVTTEELCREWAEMMSSKASETIHLDTLAELANIIAGHWLSRHFGDSELLKLNPPEVSPAESSHWSDLASNPSLVTLTVDGHALILAAFVQD